MTITVTKAFTKMTKCTCGAKRSGEARQHFLCPPAFKVVPAPLTVTSFSGNNFIISSGGYEISQVTGSYLEECGISHSEIFNSFVYCIFFPLWELYSKACSIILARCPIWTIVAAKFLSFPGGPRRIRKEGVEDRPTGRVPLEIWLGGLRWSVSAHRWPPWLLWENKSPIFVIWWIKVNSECVGLSQNCWRSVADPEILKGEDNVSTPS